LSGRAGRLIRTSASTSIDLSTNVARDNRAKAAGATNRRAVGSQFSGTLARMVQVGGFELYSVITGRFRLDGGAMFGVVPRVLWSQVSEPDDQNRISLAARTLMAINRAARRVILVDTGCGSKWTPEAAARFAIRNDDQAIDRHLALLGFSRTDVTDVVVTHLHFDHNGGLTDWLDGSNEQTVPRYSNARHWIHRKHWDHAHAPHQKDRASFLPHDFAALSDSGLLEFVEGDAPSGPCRGWSWLISHGHTPYQLHPVFDDGGTGVVFAGDIVPTRHHLAPPWVMAYDMQPTVTIDEKRSLYERCIDTGLAMAFPHDPDVAGVFISGNPRKPVIRSPLELSLR